MTVAILNASTVTKFISDTDVYENCLKERFDAIDVDRDGVLSRSELQEGFGRLMTIEYNFPSKEETNVIYNTVFDKFDEDQNGTIDRKEFRSLVTEIMQAVARGVGNSPIHIALDQDSLLMKAVEHELALGY